MKKLGIVILMAIVAVATVRAETLALWELDDLIASSSNATVDTVHADMSSTDLTAGAGLDTAISWPNAMGGFADWRLTPNLQNAILNEDYFTTTLTADAGKMVSYSNLFARFAVNAGDDGAYLTFHLLSDKTGFTTNGALDSFTVEDNVAPNYNSIIYTNDFDLSAVSELQGVQGDTEFRIYVTATNGNRMAIGHNSWLDPSEEDLRFDGIVEVATSPPPAVVVELAKWDLDDLAMNQSTGSVDWVNADMSSSDLIAQPGGFDTGIAWPNALGGFADWHLGGSLEWTLQNKPDNYFTITLEPGAGKQVTYDNLFARFAVNAGDDGAYVQFHLLSDQTGFTTNNVLGTFTVEDNVAPNYNSIIYTHEFDLSEVAELQDLTEAIEFRIYATATNGNRMAIGHNHFTQGSDDLVVSGSIDDLPYVPATILSWTSISDSVMKLVIDAPADPALYYPKGSTDLTGGFSDVAHSDNAGGPFVVTNLSFSTAEGDDEAIYVETTEDAKFFGVGEE